MKKTLLLIVALIFYSNIIQAQSKPLHRFQVEGQNFYSLYTKKQLVYNGTLETKRDPLLIRGFAAFSPINNLGLALTYSLQQRIDEVDDEIGIGLAIGYFNSSINLEKPLTKLKGFYYDLYLGTEVKRYTHLSDGLNIHKIKYSLQGSCNYLYKWVELNAGVKLNIADYYKIKSNHPYLYYRFVDDIREFSPIVYPELNIGFNLNFGPVSVYIQSTKVLSKSKTLFEANSSISIGAFGRLHAALL